MIAGWGSVIWSRAKWIMVAGTISATISAQAPATRAPSATADVHVAANATAAHQVMEWFRARTVPLV